MSSAHGLPEFTRVERGKRVALVHPACVPTLSDALLDGKGATAAGIEGRTTLLRCEIPFGSALIRPYRRGGAMAKLLGDRFVFSNRPRWEFMLHSHLWKASVPTVMPLGVMWERSGVFTRGAYATLELQTPNLLDYLRTHPEPDLAYLAECGRTIHAMHRAGVLHGDLQVKNILVTPHTGLVLDFANASPYGRLFPRRDLKRLKRSFIKQGLPLAAFAQIQQAYDAS